MALDQAHLITTLDKMQKLILDQVAAAAGNNNRIDVGPGCGGGAGAFIDALSITFFHLCICCRCSWNGWNGWNKWKNGGAGAAGLIEVTEFYQWGEDGFLLNYTDHISFGGDGNIVKAGAWIAVLL